MRKMDAIELKNVERFKSEPNKDMQKNDLIETASNKTPMSVHLMAGWPLLLMLIGGAVGGALGAVAYLINLKVYKSDLSKMNKILANLMCGMFAIILWWSIASWIQTSL